MTRQLSELVRWFDRLSDSADDVDLGGYFHLGFWATTAALGLPDPSLGDRIGTAVDASWLHYQEALERLASSQYCLLQSLGAATMWISETNGRAASSIERVNPELIEAANLLPRTDERSGFPLRFAALAGVIVAHDTCYDLSSRSA